MKDKTLLSYGALLNPSSLTVKETDNINMKLYESYIFDYSSDLIEHFCDGINVTCKLINDLINNKLKLISSTYPAITDLEKEVLEIIFTNSSVIIRDIWGKRQTIPGTRWCFGENGILIAYKDP